MRIGKYELEERIGAGGMAEVYRARAKGPEGFEKVVALKRVLPAFNEDPEFVRMFVQEARVAGLLQHANIVQIFDFDQEDGRYFLAMEYVSGKDLRVVIRATGVGADGPGFPVAFAAFVAGEILKALHYAQQTSRLVHRDISPHNVLLGFSGDVKLGDFGIAKAQAAASATRTGSIKGKLAYMSPEQAGGREVDGRSDLFSLGVVLYEMLSGRRPFGGASDAELVAQVLAAPVPSVREHRPDLPDDLVSAVDRLLRKDPGERFQTPLEALTALTSCACYRADPVGMGVWLRGLFPEDAREPPTRATASANARTRRSEEGEGAQVVTRTAVGETSTVGRRRRSSPWLGALPLVAGLVVLGALTWQGPKRGRTPGAAAGADAAFPATASLPARPEGASVAGKPALQAHLEGVSVAGEPARLGPEATPPSPVAEETRTADDEGAQSDPFASPEPPDSNEDGSRAAAAKTSKARRRARRAKAAGELFVGVFPWADIRINGKFYGRTPRKIALPAGRYRLELSGPSSTKRERIVIKPGETTTVRLTLK